MCAFLKRLESERFEGRNGVVKTQGIVEEISFSGPEAKYWGGTVFISIYIIFRFSNFVLSSLGEI